MGIGHRVLDQSGGDRSPIMFRCVNSDGVPPPRQGRGSGFIKATNQLKIPPVKRRDRPPENQNDQP